MAYGSALVDTISTSGNLSVTGNVIVSGNNTANTYNLVSQALGSATAGTLEYDGTAPYFTPLGTQRGVIPGMQYYKLDSAYAGSNATGAQRIFGVGCTLTTNTVYAFESVFALSKSAGTTSHTISIVFGGTATLNKIGYLSMNQAGSAQTDVPYAGTLFNAWQIAATAVTTTAITTASQYRWYSLKGTVSINGGGTFIPQYSLSAAPGGAYTTVSGGYFLIYPIGAAGSNINVGTWA